MTRQHPRRGKAYSALQSAHAAAPIALPSWITTFLFPALLIIAAAFLAVHPITDPDFWHHAAFGREVITSGKIPHADIFSHTAAGHYWISSGWFPSLALHGLHSTVGPTGPVLFAFVLVIAAALATYFFASRRYDSPAAAALILLAALFASYPRFNPRPDILSQFLIMPLVLLLVSTESTARTTGAAARRLWVLPSYIMLWANCHALFFLGLIVIGLYSFWRLLLWRATRHRSHLQALLPCALCSVTWLLNPYGWRMLQFVYDNATLPMIGQRIFELKPLFNAETLRGGLPIHILLSVLLLLLIAATTYWRTQKQIPIWRALTILLFVFLLFYQRRQIGLAGAAIPALLAPNLMWLENLLRRKRWIGILAPATAALLICSMRVVGLLEVSRGWPRGSVDCQWFPCNAASFLRENPAPSNLFHDLYTGSYLLHELGPKQKVFIDGRLEIYKDGPWQDYFGPPERRMSSDQLFAKYNVNMVLLDIRGTQNNHGHLANQLASRADWLPVYFDDQYCAMVRETSATQPYLQQHGFRFVNPLNWNRLGEATTEPARAEALEEAARALAVAPKSAAANTAMALVQYNRGNRAEGDKFLKAAQAIDPTIQLARPR